MDVLLAILLVLLAAGGVILAALQLPGTWIILAAGIGYDWYYDWQRIGWQGLAMLLGVAVVAEAVDTFASLVVAKRAGASRRASIGALLGGFGGMFFLSLPAPVVGTIAGGLIGCFAGALVGEWTVRSDLSAGARVGLFATCGRLAGLLLKTAAAFAMAGALIGLAIW